MGRGPSRGGRAKQTEESATTFSRPGPAFASPRGHAGETDAFVAPSRPLSLSLSPSPLVRPCHRSRWPYRPIVGWPLPSLVPFSCRGRGTLFFFLPSLRGRHRQPTAFCNRDLDRAHGLGRFCVLAPTGRPSHNKEKKRPNGNKARQKKDGDSDGDKRKRKETGPRLMKEKERSFFARPPFWWPL